MRFMLRRPPNYMWLLDIEPRRLQPDTAEHDKGANKAVIVASRAAVLAIGKSFYTDKAGL